MYWHSSAYEMFASLQISCAWYLYVQNYYVINLLAQQIMGSNASHDDNGGSQLFTQYLPIWDTYAYFSKGRLWDNADCAASRLEKCNEI